MDQLSISKTCQDNTQCSFCSNESFKKLAEFLLLDGKNIAKDLENVIYIAIYKSDQGITPIEQKSLYFINELKQIIDTI